MLIIDHIMHYFSVYALILFVIYQFITILSANKLTTENKIVHVMMATGGGLFLPYKKTNNKVHDIVSLTGKWVGWGILSMLMIGVFLTFLHLIVAAISVVIVASLCLFFIKIAADGIADATTFATLFYLFKKN